jgi:hypothetical protein
VHLFANAEMFATNSAAVRERATNSAEEKNWQLSEFHK